jgi:hypothetical protein
MLSSSYDTCFIVQLDFLSNNKGSKEVEEEVLIITRRIRQVLRGKSSKEMDNGLQISDIP